MTAAIILALGVLCQGKDEAKLRGEFAKEFKAKDAAKRVEVVKKLEGSKEEKTIEALAGALKDPEKTVKKAAADALAGCTDAGGVAIKPLGSAMMSKEETPEVRYACAQALSKARYKVEAIEAYIHTISNISNKDRDLFEFGKNMTVVLEGFTGEKFGYEKLTPQLWANWWEENKAKIRKEDDAKRAEYKKGKK